MRTPVLLALLCFTFIILSGCEGGNRVAQEREGVAHKEHPNSRLIGKFFGINYEGGDDLHALQFNLYGGTSGKIEGDYYDIFKLVDSIPDEMTDNHINEKKLIGPEIFESYKPHVGKIISGSILGKNIHFKTSFIEYDKGHKSAWEFNGEIDGLLLKGVLKQFFTPVYDDTKTVYKTSIGKVQKSKKTFILKKIE